MTTELPSPPELFPLDMLTRAVRNALNAPNGVIADWQCQPVSGGASTIFGGAIAGVYRITGLFRAGADVTPWSLILKIIGTTPHATSPANAAYWRRELLVYQSALRDCLPSGLQMPRCFASTENETTAWMWLEDLGEMRANHWDPEQYARVAYLLGQFNYLAGLHDVGWQGDEGEVRIGYAIGSAFRNATPLGITSVLDPEQQASIAAVSGRSIEQCLDRWAEVNHRVLNTLDALDLFHH